MRALQGTNFGPEEGADIVLLQLLFSKEGLLELVTEGKMTRDLRHEGWRFHTTSLALSTKQWGYCWMLQQPRRLAART